MESESHLRTSPSLLIRIRDHRDAEAWSKFVETYTPLIYGYCRYYKLQEANSADVTQEVLSRVARAVRSFEYQPERGRFRDWLGRVSRNEILRNVEKEKSKPGLPRDAGICEADPVWSEQFHSHLLKVALDIIEVDFETETWQAFRLVWLENNSAAETAKKLSIPIHKVYVAKSRVLKRLRHEIESLADDIVQF